jgi:hypothetical protein
VSAPAGIAPASASAALTLPCQARSVRRRRKPWESFVATPMGRSQRLSIEDHVDTRPPSNGRATRDFYDDCSVKQEGRAEPQGDVFEVTVLKLDDRAACHEWDGPERRRVWYRRSTAHAGPQRYGFCESRIGPHRGKTLLARSGPLYRKGVFRPLTEWISSLWSVRGDR